MAVQFSEDSTDRLVAVDSSSLRISAFTWCTWLRFGSFGGTRQLWLHGTNASDNRKKLEFDSSQRFDLVVSRSGTNARFRSNPPAGIATGVWYFVACTYSTTFGALIYFGSLQTPAALLSDDVFTIGSGSTKSVAGFSYFLGSDGSVATAGWRVATNLYIEGQQSLETIRQLQFMPRPIPGTVLYWNCLAGGNQVDLSGHGNGGISTGTSYREHPPLPPAFGYERRVVRQAASRGSRTAGPFFFG